MAIARNKKPDPDAIAAFGAAAEARPEAAAPTPAAVAAVAAPKTAKKAEPAATAVAGEGRPKSSLIRWTDEELRDRLMDYSTRERYSMQHLMTEALRLGIEQIENR